MSAQLRTISLPDEQAEYIDGLVAAGKFATAVEVVGAGLQALKDQDETIEQWLRDEVLPVVEAMEADPNRGIPAEQVFRKLRAHHEERLKARAG